jgi:hypothetical protein
LGQSVVCSRAIGIAWEFAPRAFRMGVSFQSSFTRESFASSGGNAVDRAPAGFQNRLGQSVVCSRAIGIAWEFAPRAFRMGVSFSRASFENHSLPGSGSVASSPLASKLVGPVGCSQVEFIGDSPRACSEWKSVSVEPHSRITRFPAVARLPVHRWLPNWLGQSVVWNSLGNRPARVQNGSQFSVQHHSRITRFLWR